MENPGRRPQRPANGQVNRAAGGPRRRIRYGTSARKRRSFSRSARFGRGIWIAAGGAAVLLAAVICVICFRGSPAPDMAVPADVPQETAEPTTVVTTPTPNAEPVGEETSEPDVEPPAEGSDFVADYRVLDGIPQTDHALGLPEGEQVDDSFFNDTVFIGDSITLKLQQFIIRYRKEYPNMLGNATFLTAGSFSVLEALRDVSDSSLHPAVDGVKMSLEDALAAKGAKKVYIMLGMNDVSHSGVATSVGNMGRLLFRIREKSPDIEIFVQSVTPRYTGSKPKNETIFDYDIHLYEEIAKLNDPKIHFVDVAYVMRDEEGKLYDSYCSDKSDLAMHFTDIACQEWIKYLYTHTGA